MAGAGPRLKWALSGSPPQSSAELELSSQDPRAGARWLLLCLRGLHSSDDCTAGLPLEPGATRMTPRGTH